MLNQDHSAWPLSLYNASLRKAILWFGSIATESTKQSSPHTLDPNDQRWLVTLGMTGTHLNARKLREEPIRRFVCQL